jgi:hypothetical protein
VETGEAQRQHSERVAAQQARDMTSSLALSRDTLTAQNMSQRAWLSYSGVEANRINDRREIARTML